MVVEAVVSGDLAWGGGWDTQSMLMKLDEATRPAAAPPDGVTGVGRVGATGPSSRSTTPPEPEASPDLREATAAEGDVPTAAALANAIQSAVVLSENLEASGGLRRPSDGDVSARTTADFQENVGDAGPRITADFAEDGEGLGGGGLLEVPVFSVAGVTVEVRSGTAASMPDAGAAEPVSQAAEQGEPWKGSLRLDTAQGRLLVPPFFPCDLVPTATALC